MKARGIGLLGALAAMVVLLGACSDDSGGVPKVEKDVMIQRADAVCKVAATDLNGIVQAAAVTSASTADQVREVLVTQVLPRLDKELGDLKDLGEPKVSKREWDNTVKAFDTGLSALKQKAQTDPAAAFAGANTTFADANAKAKAKAFGLKECGT